MFKLYRHRSRSQSKDHSNSRQCNHSANNAEQNTTNNTSSPNSSNFCNSTQSAQRPRSNERKGKNRSVSFSTSQRNNTATPNSSGHKPPLVDPNCSQVQEILSVLKSLQEDMANVRARIHALELADQRMSRLERHIFGHLQDDILPPDLNNSSHMLPISGPVLPSLPVPIPRSTISSSPIPETADEATINKE
ncbi:18931_t:CDS:2, partial [Rhizophagus irregularis]